MIAAITGRPLEWIMKLPLRTNRPSADHKWRDIVLVLCLLVLPVIARIAHLSTPSHALVLSKISTGDRLEDLPRTILWAWERPEHLTFIDPASVGVAFLARTLYLRGSEVMVRPRLQPLRVPPRTSLVAVVRIETDALKPLTNSETQRQKMVDAVAELRSLPGIRAVQIDFDARQSERQFYRELLREVRAKLDASIPLSMTALASWCIYDNWLAELSMDEAVPMLFRMGVDERNVLSFLNRHERFPATQCQASVGVSLDEPLARLPAHRRIYVFNPKPWSKSALQTILVESKQR
jgi:uncharacterized protein DUF3142